jgi:CheY-like chemotaxis protein
MDGYEATRIIREQEAQGLGNPPRLPIIALTANAMDVDREACFAAGMDDFLSRPLTMESLHAVLDRWLSPRQGLRPPPVSKENPRQSTEL